MTRRFLIWYWSGGGGAVFAVNLAHHLNARFGECATLSLRAGEGIATRAEALNVATLAADIVSDRRRPLETAAGLAAGAAILAKHIQLARADAVIVPMNFAAAAPLSATVKLPLIYCAHDPAPHPGDYAARLQVLTQSVLLQRANIVVALSQYSANALRGARRKLRVAPLLSVFPPRNSKAAQRRETVELLFAGRMIAYKGIDMLAGALSDIADRHDWRVTIAGEGPALSEAAMAQFRWPQVTEVRPGWMSDEDLNALISDHDVLLAPYTSATQSGVVAEALVAGRPVVATPVGALPEQLAGGEAGWIADAATPEAYARALQSMLQAKPDAFAAKAARARALSDEAWRSGAWDWLQTDRLGAR
jgi:glycosyltransferase involved in cell wall biosynthesis